MQPPIQHFVSKSVSVICPFRLGKYSATLAVCYMLRGSYPRLPKRIRYRDREENSGGAEQHNVGLDFNAEGVNACARDQIGISDYLIGIHSVQRSRPHLCFSVRESFSNCANSLALAFSLLSFR